MKTKSKRAGLSFPVGRTKSIMRRHTTHNRVSDKAAVALTAALEYFVSEVIELATSVTKKKKRLCVMKHDILGALEEDEELARMFHNIVIAGGGVKQELPAKLRSKYTQKKLAEAARKGK